MKDGKVHDLALKELKKLLRKGKLLSEKVTRRVSIELINSANNKVAEEYNLPVRNHNIKAKVKQTSYPAYMPINFDVNEIIEGKKQTKLGDF